MAAYKDTSFGAGCYKGKSFVPTIWSARLLSNLHAKQVLAGLTTREYEGEIKGAGDTVRVFGVGAVTVACYEPNKATASVLYCTLNDNYMTIVVEKADYFGLKMEDIEVAQSKPAYVNELTKEAGISLAKRSDAYLYNLMHDAAISTTSNCWGKKGGSSGCSGYGPRPACAHGCVVTKYLWKCGCAVSSVYNNLVRIGVTLDDLLAPEDGRFVVCPSFLKQAFLTDDRFVANNSAGQAGMRDRGVLGAIAGFEVITMPKVAFTNYDTAASGGDAWAVNCTDLYRAIVGVKGAAAYVETISKIENLRLEGYFADAIRGLHVYGGGVLRPEWLMAVSADDPNV